MVLGYDVCLDQALEELEDVGGDLVLASSEESFSASEDAEVGRLEGGEEGVGPEELEGLADLVGAEVEDTRERHYEGCECGGLASQWVWCLDEDGC